MSMDKCPGHYKVHVHGRDSPGRPVHGHCPIPLPALPSPSSSSSSSSSSPPPPPPPPSPSPSYSFESADGVQLSEKNSPWKTSFSELCYICGYFGHGHKQCPNILEQFRGLCLKCYGVGHVAKDCVNAAREPPMRSGFKKPTSFCS